MKMKDRPISAKIFLHLAENTATGEDFIGLSSSLHSQNLIFKKPDELRKKGNVLELYVIFCDLHSFKNWTKNTYIQKYWSDKFDSFLEVPPKAVEEKNVVLEVDNIFNCTCDNSDFYILQGRTFEFIDELTCNKCCGQISYSKVPIEIKLEDWQTKYQRVYLNWLESGLFEEEALEELINYKKGKLNLAGEKIRCQLSEYFKIPVYISHFVEEPDENDTCLVCGQSGIESGMKRPNRICQNCNTIFGYNEK